MLSNEVEDHLQKGAVVPTPRPGEEWVLQHLFPGTPKGWRPQTHLEPEVLQLKCLQDFVHYEDSTLHHSNHAPTPAVDQRGFQGWVLPCMSGAPAPPVPQIPPAGHQLPIQCTTVWPLIGSPSLHKAHLIAQFRLLGVQLYAYLDDLLIVGDSEVEAVQSVQETIQVLIQAGFIVNLKKYKPALTQDMVYIGARFCVDLGRLYLLETLIQSLTACVRSSKVGVYRPAHQFLSLLGLMVAMLQPMEYAYIHMRPIQWHLKQWGTHTTSGLQHPIFVSNDLVPALLCSGGWTGITYPR